MRIENMKSFNQPLGTDWTGVLGRLLLVIALGSVVAGCKPGFGRATDNKLLDVEVRDEGGSELDLDPNFNTDQTNYTIESVSQTNDEITFKAELSDDEEASMTISATGLNRMSIRDDTEITVPLLLGDNEIRIVVEAENEAKRTYIFEIERETDPSDDNTLAALSITGAQLDTVFASEETAYTSLVPRNRDEITINAVLGDIEGAAMTINNTSNSDPAVTLANGTDILMVLQAGENIIQIAVTAADDDVQTYTLNITQSDDSGTDTTLRSLAVEGIVLSPTFDSGLGVYDVDTNFLINTAEISWTASSEFALVTLGESIDASDGGSLSLVAGDTATSAEITVSQVDEPENMYRINITREAGDGLEVSAYVKSADSAANDIFGQAIALDDDIMVIGAPSDDNSAGSVHVLLKEDDGSWGEPEVVRAADRIDGSDFGQAVAISGNFMAVGAPNANAGRVYIFTRLLGDWEQSALIEADGRQDGDEFGASLSLIGNTLVVGAPGRDDDKGRAYVYSRSGNNWSLEDGEIDTSSGEAGDRFGASVALNLTDPEEVFIGAPLENSESGDEAEAGAVYVFRKTDGTWNEQGDVVRAETSIAGAKFGAAIAAKGNRLVVGAPQSIDDVAESTGTGSVIAFERADSGWNERQVLSPEAGVAMEFGSSVALSSDMLVVGAPLEDSDDSAFDNNASDNTGATNAGAAYLYAFDADVDNEWELERYLKASNSGAEDQFGRAVAFSGQTLVISAPLEDSGTNGTEANTSSADEAASESGAVYIVE